MKSKYSRRDIVKQGSVAVGGITILGLAACTGNKDKAVTKAPEVSAPAQPTAGAQGGDPLIDLDNGVAKSLKYVHDASKVDPKLRTAKGDVAGAEQFCNNCVHYKKVDGQEYGTCALIPVAGKHVAGKGWCVTWTKKA